MKKQTNKNTYTICRLYVKYEGYFLKNAIKTAVITCFETMNIFKNKINIVGFL